MSGYEVEHDIPANGPAQSNTRRRRPDLSTFFSTLDLVDTSGARRPNNTHSLPLPADVSAAFRNLANAFEMMRGGAGSTGDNNGELLGGLVASLMSSAEHPPEQVHGVSDEFLEQLERVPKKSLKAGMSCAICALPFLEDPYPLVVRLPCHRDHIFDLACIQPWLKLNPTCPLDRQKLLKEKSTPPPVGAEEQEYDDMFG